MNTLDNNWIISNEKGTFFDMSITHHILWILHPINFVCILLSSSYCDEVVKHLPQENAFQLIITPKLRYFSVNSKVLVFVGFVAYQLMWYGPTTMSPFIVYTLCTVTVHKRKSAGLGSNCLHVKDYKTR
jgi:hypothetical protein